MTCTVMNRISLSSNAASQTVFVYASMTVTALHSVIIKYYQFLFNFLAYSF